MYALLDIPARFRYVDTDILKSPVEGTATDLTLKYFKAVASVAEPLSMKEPVGFLDSSFKYSVKPILLPILTDFMRGVLPSPKVIFGAIREVYKLLPQAQTPELLPLLKDSGERAIKRPPQLGQ